DELLGYVAAQHAELETALADADPADRVWTWGPQQDVAFVLRRQVQEATVHTVDVEQVLGDVRPVPTDVGLDGSDEWLEAMVPRAPPAAPPPPPPPSASTGSTSGWRSWSRARCATARPRRPTPSSCTPSTQ